MPIPSEPKRPFKPVPAVSAACFSTELRSVLLIHGFARLFPGTRIVRKAVERAGSGSFERPVLYGKRLSVSTHEIL